MRRASLFFLILSLGTVAAATTIHVPADQPNIADGLAVAGTGDTVLVACGVYAEHDLVLPSGVTLRSESGDPACVTLDVQQLGRGIFVEQAEAGTRIEGLTIQGAYLDQDSGQWGGGIACYYSQIEIRRCVLKDNEAFLGGGGIRCGATTALIENCVFDHCSGIDGAGLYCSGGSDTDLIGCLFTNNDGVFWGGGVYFQNGHMLMSQCTLVGNNAGWGSGVWFLYHADFEVENSIIAFNDDGPGIYLEGYDEDTQFSVACSDVYHNEAGNYGGVLTDETGMNGNISEHPYFCDAAAGDFSLALGSPCLPGNNSCGVLMGAFGLGCEEATGVPETAAGAGPTALLPNLPNPFNPSTLIRFRLADPGRVDLAVYDLAGRRVRELASAREFTAGEHSIQWDGRDGRGRGMASGVYIARLSTDGKSDARRLTLLK